MNIGHSSRLGYDQCAYDDRLEESVSPLNYRVNPIQISNCDGCLSVYGPRGRHGVSTTVGHTTAPSQDLVDVDSVLSNRNVLLSKCKQGRVNDIDVTKFKLQHAPTCNNFLDPVASRLTNPTANYRGVGINRFYDLDRNPQQNIFWNFSVNTQLEARDNHKVRVPHLASATAALPEEKDEDKCRYTCTGECVTADACTYRMYAQQ